MVCLSGSTYALYDFFVAVAPSVMTHDLMRSFHITSTELGWIGASFFYAYAVMQIPSGWMLDRFGVRRMLVGYSLLSGLGLLLFAMTSQYWVAALARFLSGTGVCIGFLASYALASRWLPHRYFSTVAASLHLLGTVGAILAQGPLAKMVNYLGWRETIFYLSMVTFVLAFMYLFLIRDGKKKNKQSTVSFKEAVIYCVMHPQLKWIALTGFLAWLPVSIIGSLWGVPYLMHVFQWDNVTASNVCSFFWIGSGLGGFVLCGLSEWRKQRKAPLTFFFLLAFFTSVVVIYFPQTSYVMLVSALMILGMSVAIQTMTFSLIKENVPLEYFSTASGLNNSVSMLSSAFGQAMVGILMDWHRVGRHMTGLDYHLSDYQFALGIIPIISIIGYFVVQTKIEETHCQSVRYHDEKQHRPQQEHFSYYCP